MPNTPDPIALAESFVSIAASIASAKAGAFGQIVVTEAENAAQGDPADAIFYIQEGRIKLTVLSNQGKEAVVAILVSRNGSFMSANFIAGQPAERLCK